MKIVGRLYPPFVVGLYNISIAYPTMNKGLQPSCSLPGRLVMINKIVFLQCTVILITLQYMILKFPLLLCSSGILTSVAVDLCQYTAGGLSFDNVTNPSALWDVLTYQLNYGEVQLKTVSHLI